MCKQYGLLKFHVDPRCRFFLIPQLGVVMMMIMMTGCDSWIWVTLVIEEALKKVAPGSGLAGSARARVRASVCSVLLSCLECVLCVGCYNQTMGINESIQSIHDANASVVGLASLVKGTHVGVDVAE